MGGGGEGERDRWVEGGDGKMDEEGGNGGFGGGGR